MVLVSLVLSLRLAADALADRVVSERPIEAVVAWSELVGMHLVALLAVGLVLELGPAFTRRLKKVGPVEFFEREMREEVRHILPEVRKIMDRAPKTGPPHGPPRVFVTQDPLVLSEEEKYFTEKANALIYYVEYSELRFSRVASDPGFHRLLSQMTAVALDQCHWARAIDRLELLEEISGERYEHEEIEKRRALGALMLAESLPPERTRRRQDLFKRAKRAARTAMGIDPDDWRPISYLATANFRLGDVERSCELFRRTHELCRSHAPTKYNLACAYAQLGEKEEAFEWLGEIGRNDLELEQAVKFADRDPDLGPLREPPELERRLERVLTRMRGWLEAPP
ncbi:MAG: hypothetical protein PVG07_02195 [Acidobacteriota bacterium]